MVNSNKKLVFDKNKLISGLNALDTYKCLFDVHSKNAIPDYSCVKKSYYVACYYKFFNAYNIKFNTDEVSSELMKNEKYLTSQFTVKPKKCADGKVITIEDMLKWIELCEKYKLLPPKCISTKEIKKDGNSFKVKMTVYVEGVFQPTLYIWLDNFRHMCEDQGFIRSVLYLHVELNINFYVAYVVGSYFNVTNVGHHCLAISKNSIYDIISTDDKLQKLNDESTLDLTTASVLYRAAQNFPKLFDDNLKLVMNANSSAGAFITKSCTEGLRATTWCCNYVLRDIARNEKHIPINLKMLNHENVDKIVYAAEEEKRIALHKKIKQ